MLKDTWCYRGKSIGERVQAIAQVTTTGTDLRITTSNQDVLAAVRAKEACCLHSSRVVSMGRMGALKHIFRRSYLVVKKRRTPEWLSDL